MKMKEVTAYLSIAAFVQVLIFAFGSEFLAEIMKPVINKERLLLQLVVLFTLIAIIMAIYSIVFKGARKRNE